LIGNVDNYKGLVKKDLITLEATIVRATAAGLKVVITPLSLPGMRWVQNNNDVFDGRIWKDKIYQDQAVLFWKDLAMSLKKYPSIVAYNLVNEPAPEKEAGLSETANFSEQERWYRKYKGTTRDLPLFYEKVIEAIRKVDPKTPVMVDGGWYASADGFTYWPEKLSDKHVLYAIHMYEPYEATSAPILKRKSSWSYPGLVPFADGVQWWDANSVNSWLQRTWSWAERHKIPSNRIVVSEFGCIRKLDGCRQYIEDVLNVLDSKSAHWAFYSFREDSWDGMDYELGKEPVRKEYWDNIEKNLPDTTPRFATEEFKPISSRLKKNSLMKDMP
jgi:hypothetical protein